MHQLWVSWSDLGKVLVFLSQIEPLIRCIESDQVLFNLLKSSKAPVQKVHKKCTQNCTPPKQNEADLENSQSLIDEGVFFFVLMDRSSFYSQ